MVIKKGTEKKLIQALHLPHLGILLTTYCNLNCRNCADLIPKRKNMHYDKEQLKSDLLQVLNVVESIEEVLLIGGETFMYPWLEEIIEFCGKLDRVGKIIITTNGTFQPKGSLLNYIKDNNVIIRISGYPDFVVPFTMKQKLSDS